MRRRFAAIVPSLTALVWMAAGGSAHAQAEMSFFVTSTGNGADAGNQGGLAGADARCQALGDVAGATGRVWRAYLSTAPIFGFGGVLVHARDRIGTGPWHNYVGAEVAADVDGLHANGIDPGLMLTDTGGTVPSNEHDILTGSNPDGTALESFPGNPSAPAPTCFNWTSSSAGDYAYVGHADWAPGQSWNSAHESECHEAGLAATAGSGRLYCFALAEPPLFADGFETGDTSAWDTAAGAPDLGVTSASALDGTSSGLQAFVDDTSALFVLDDTPSDAARYRARFYLDPNGFDPGESLNHRRTRTLLALSEPNRRVAAIVLRRLGGAYSVAGRAREDDNSQVDTPFFPIPDAPHAVEIDLVRASGPDALDGSFTLWIDGVLMSRLTGLANSLTEVDFVRLGALSVKAGASGTLYFDEFVSKQQTYIGP